MSQRQTCKRVHLETLTGSTGHINTLMREWLETETGQTGHINKLWLAYFQANGATSNHFNTAAREYLIAIGCTPAALPTMWKQAWCEGLVGGGASTLAFHALTHDASVDDNRGWMTGVKTGTTSANYENCTDTRYVPDHEDIYRSYGSEEIAWWGGRKVENLLTDQDPDTWSTNNNCTVTSGVTDPLGGTNAYRITADANNAAIREQAGGGAAGQNSRATIWMRRVTGTGGVDLYEGASTATGDRTDVTSALTSSWQRISADIGSPTTGARNFGVFLDSSGDEIEIAFGQLEDVSGQSNQNPGEYIPTSGASAYKVANYANGNTVASNVVTEAAGAVFATAPKAYAGPARTNSITYSRDLTNAAWSWTSVGTRAYDAVGLTGEPNTAATLNDTSGSGQNRVQETITIPDDSNTNVLRAFIAKDSNQTRFPEMQLLLQGGTQQAIIVQLDTETGATHTRTSTGTTDVDTVDRGDWWEFLIAVDNNSTGNVSAQCYIYAAFTGTLGNGQENSATGSIIVGNVELHENATIAEVRGTTPIFTEGSTVSVDGSDIDFPDDEWQNPVEGVVYAEMVLLSDDLTTTRGLFQGTGSTSYILSVRNNIVQCRYTNTSDTDSSSQYSGLSLSVDTNIKLGAAFHSTDADLAICVDGTYDPTPSTAFKEMAGNNLRVGRSGNTINSAMLIGELQIYSGFADYAAAESELDGLMA
jgi:hypothetical protein